MVSVNCPPFRSRGSVGAEFDEVALIVVGLVGGVDRLVVEVPALPALGHAQLPVPLRAWRAFAFERGTARHVNGFELTGDGVEPPEGDGADAHAVLLGDLFDDSA
ncbi:hypothetical protein IMZ11_31895 [Microtetraspora sp. AC03309]|nr:hypothetical protein [Microtetraspora sp. AC03309]